MKTADIEIILSELHEKEYVLLTGNATAGISIALKALGLENNKIAMPNNVCMNVPIAVKLSNNSPVYIDISEGSSGLSIDMLNKRISKTAAVIAVHSYGTVCEIDEIKKICTKHNVPLIEDFAVAQGAKIKNKPVGCFGDISVTSFGAGKIIDAGHGGALLTNDRALFDEIRHLESRLSFFSIEHSEKIGQLNKSYKQLYNDSYGSFTEKHITAFQSKVNDSLEAFLFRFDDSYRELIFNNLNDIENNIETRNKNSRKIKEIFKSYACQDITIIDPPQGSVYWRFNIFIEKNRTELLRLLLRKKFKISSWYPPVDLFFESRAKSNVDTPQSDRSGDTILNLWVNHEIDDVYINEVTHEILSFMESGRNERKKIYTN